MYTYAKKFFFYYVVNHLEHKEFHVCVRGNAAFSGIHELCESFEKHVKGYELSGLALVAKVRVL